jgi:hypothetical protein
VRFAPGGFGRICEDPPDCLTLFFAESNKICEVLWGCASRLAALAASVKIPPIVSHCSLLKAIIFVKFWGCASRLAALAAYVKIPRLSHTVLC